MTSRPFEPPKDATSATPLRNAVLRDPPAPDPSRPRVREGPSFARPSSPGWDLTSVRVRRLAKRRFEAFRYRVSVGGRIVPHWEAFELLLDLADPFAGLVEAGERAS